MCVETVENESIGCDNNRFPELNGRTCSDMLDCCNCGETNDGCGCNYCFSCNACEFCLSED